MKIKIDYITNSSSASFMIPKTAITEDQIKMIHDHIEVSHFLERAYPDNKLCKFGNPSNNDEWNIEETNHSIRGYTYMDNFDMFAFLIVIGVPESEIHYETQN